MVAAFLCLANLSSTATEPNALVVPRDLANSFGAQDTTINGYHKQLVYSSSQFADATGDQLMITAVAFRWYETTPSSSYVIPSIGITMGTFEKPLVEFSQRAELNWGADQKLVVAARDLSVILKPPASPSEFGLKLQLAEPFFYDRSKGNLLIEVGFGQNNAAVGLDGQIYVSGDVVRSTTPALPNVGFFGPALQLTYTVIPEPAPAFLLCFGVVSMLTLTRWSSK